VFSPPPPPPTNNKRAPEKLWDNLRFLGKSDVVTLQYYRESNPCHATHGCSHELLFSLRKLPPPPLPGPCQYLRVPILVWQMWRKCCSVGFCSFWAVCFWSGWYDIYTVCRLKVVWLQHGVPWSSFSGYHYPWHNIRITSVLRRTLCRHTTA